jgi:hypothetical protein
MPEHNEALSIYLPRPLDFLLTLINKIEGLNTSVQRKQLLYTLALIAADEGSTLWPWPGGRSRPRQLKHSATVSRSQFMACY